MSRLDRITSNPDIVHGKPAIRGTRLMVQTLLELLSSGMTYDEILDDYAELELDDILAAIEYGSLAVESTKVPLGAA